MEMGSKFGVGPKIERRRIAAVKRIRPGDVIIMRYRHPHQRARVFIGMIAALVWS
jgi:hypothetical protein